ncbi:hypothetical protein NL108_018090 [Boleophthalmus pectinirostris]|nr:hypothetical protein NL108_018090 [Boleophthalmus pectinirostris]
MASVMVDRLVERNFCVSPVFGSELPNVCVDSELVTPVGAVEVAVRPNTPDSFPLRQPLSSSCSPRDGARLKVRLARLKMETEAKERARKAQLELRIRKLEIEAETAIKLKQLEFESQAHLLTSSGSTTATDLPSTFQSTAPFDVSTNISLVPTFGECDVDSYLTVFERIATALKWPRDVWPILLLCKLPGKAQEAVASLPVEKSLCYDTVKAAILSVYQLVPEAYRQKFRQHPKVPSHTYSHFAREKGSLFDKWCTSSKVSDFSALRELILLEDFKQCLPNPLVLYLNEKRVQTLSEAAVLADEFMLIHKSNFPVFPPKCSSHFPVSSASLNVKRPRYQTKCFYCHKSGHLIANCPALKRKAERTAPKQSVSLSQSGSTTLATDTSQKLDSDSESLVLGGLVGQPSGRGSDLHPSDSVLLSNISDKPVVSKPAGARFQARLESPDYGRTFSYCRDGLCLGVDHQISECSCNLDSCYLIVSLPHNKSCRQLRGTPSWFSHCSKRGSKIHEVCRFVAPG